MNNSDQAKEELENGRDHGEPQNSCPLKGGPALDNQNNAEIRPRAARFSDLEI